MILEPMAGATEDVREREEKQKFRSGLVSRQNRSVLGKRIREQDEGTTAETKPQEHSGQPEEGIAPKKPRKKGPKQPNPMSVKKPKSRDLSDKRAQDTSNNLAQNGSNRPGEEETSTINADAPSGKKKRRRKPSTRGDSEALSVVED
jgi:U3 small nucleolar RNA-associated protein 23